MLPPPEPTIPGPATPATAVDGPPSASRRAVRWTAITALVGVSAVLVSRWLRFTAPEILVLQALTPIWLVVTLVATVVLAVCRDRWAAFAAIAVTAGYLAAVLPAVWPRDEPAWADGAPTVTVLVANLYFMNADPAALDPLLASDADVLVLAEVSMGWPARLAGSGLLERYPYQHTTRKGKEAETIVLSKLPITDARWGGGPVAVPIATIDVDGTPLTIVGVHPPAPVDDRQAGLWRRTLAQLEQMGRRRSTDNVVMVGDFNATRWHAPFHDLLEVGLVDAHESLGQGLSRSWPVGRAYPPFMRLDHALTTDGVAALAVHDVRVPGSDHKAFEVTLAVRPAGA